MTTSEVLGSLWRRWYVVVAGLVLTCGAVLLMGVAPDTYFTTVDVRFLAPASQRYPNVIQVQSSSLVRTAGLVKTRIEQGPTRPGEGLSLLVRGGRSAESVVLPDSGTQYSHLYTQPILTVEVTSSDPADSERRCLSLARRVRADTLALQNENGVAPVNRISTRIEPSDPQVLTLRGRVSRAGPAILLAGFAATLWLTVETDRLLLWWGRRRSTGKVASRI